MKHRLVACAVCLLMFAPRPASALELGPIEARSALYEPLDARIPMHGVQGGDIEGLKVSLGSPAQFELAGVARLQHLNLLQFAVVGESDGGGYIRVSTDEPIIESSLTFLVDVDWPRGRAVRGYKLRLFPAARTAAATSPSVSPPPKAQPASEPRASAAAPASPPPDAATYGPVRSSDTLWSIASRFRPDRSVSVQRMMLAILEANPEAFDIDNVNALNAGATLRIPTPVGLAAGDAAAAVTQVKRHHAAWKQYRETGHAPPAPSAATPAPTDTRPEPSGRVEVVSPEAPTSAAASTQDADDRNLRNRLALAIEEADAGRRQNNELTLRLSEAEDHIRELSRLVNLKNEEIAALQARLRTTAEAAAPGMKPMPTPAPSETEPMPTPAPSETEPMPTPAPSETEPMPTPAPSETEPMPTPTPSETEPVPSEAAPDEAKPESMPFGLGALPINPVFLVGGAGLLLILLGVVALLRRRRASAGEDEVFDADAGPDAVEEPDVDVAASADEENLLLELEAVAAELSDEPDGTRRRGRRRGVVPAMGAGAAVGAELEAEESDLLRIEPDSLTEDQVAELWPEDTETERALLGAIDAEDDATEISFDIDDLIADEPESRRSEDETSDEFDIDALLGEEPRSEMAGDKESDDFDISDLADLADLAAEPEGDADARLAGAVDDRDDGLDDLFDDRDTETIDPHAIAAAPAAGVGGPPDLDDDPWEAPPVELDRDGSPEPDFGAFETAEPEPDWPPASANEAVRGFETDAQDADDTEITPRVLLDETTDDGATGVFSLDDIGEDEVQTKIDLAQVYMEMGDADSARGFLEAVMAEGDADQREAAREMLSKLG